MHRATESHPSVLVFILGCGGGWGWGGVGVLGCFPTLIRQQEEILQTGRRITVLARTEWQFSVSHQPHTQRFWSFLMTRALSSHVD